MRSFRAGRRALGLSLIAATALFAGGVGAILGICGPFTDTAADAFCPFVLEVFYLGITTGTTPTTYDPTSNVTRLQMAAFLSRSVDSVLRRGSRGAALNKFWATQNAAAVQLTTVGSLPALCRCDGSDVWVANFGSNTVSRVRASDGKLLGTWSATGAFGVLTAMGRVVVSAETQPGVLYAIDPSQPPGAATIVASTLGVGVQSVVFDGARVWTANAGGSVSIVTPAASIPWTVTSVPGFVAPVGALFDGTNVWVTDSGTSANPRHLLKLDASAAVLQTVTVGIKPNYPIYDGANIWVPNLDSDSVTVVRASTGAVLQTLTGNGLSGPRSAAFDGERVLVTDYNSSAVSIFKAADLSPLGFANIGTSVLPYGSCSDGVSFWITFFTASGGLARF